MKHCVVALSVMVALAPGQGASALERGTQAEQDACQPDVLRLCLSEIPDEGAIVSCLKQNVGRLSPGCRTVMSPVRRRDATATRPQSQ